MKKAVMWYTEAARQEETDAQYRLALCYHHGLGVDFNNEKARYWMQKAADQGNEDAKKWLQESGKPSSSSSEQVYDVVEQMPSFPGGQSALFQFLSQNIHYPEVCEENGIQGRVICDFIVEADGSISDVQVKKMVDHSLDREAVRVIKSMPKWNPGKDKGKPVRVRYTVPVTFRLQ
jgi:TonB family protein